MTRLKVIVIIFFVFSFLHIDSVLGEVMSSCYPHNICAHPGDYLKYGIILGQMNSTETYLFGEMIDSNHIMVNEAYLGQNKIENSTFVLDLRTGYGYNPQENSTVIPFLAILPIPLQYNQSDISLSKEFENFNGFNRTVLTATQINNGETLVMKYDTATGILLSANSELIKQSGEPQTVQYSNDLVETNIINSDSMKTISIPAWIKNTASWWSSGEIDDASFVKAIQYLISNNIMQIPHGLSGNGSSQEIPAWIKSNAGWWAQEKISDKDFISGIQYLINTGIVKV